MSDILPFAGFALLFFALMKKFNVPSIKILLIGCFFSTIQIFIPQFEISNPYLRLLAGYFIYIDKTSFFPILSWLIYPIVGYLLGEKLITSSNKSKFYIKTALYSFSVFAITNIYLIATNSMKPNYYLFMETGFHMDFFTTLIVASVSLVILSFGYFISKNIVNTIKDLITAISININSIYCIHWVIVKILWAIAIILAFKIDYSSIFLIGFVIFTLSTILAFLRRKLKSY